MAYTPVFESSYPDGWQDLPSRTTPAYATTFDGYDEAIEHIEGYLESNPADELFNATAVTTLTDSDYIYVSVSGVIKKITLANLKTVLGIT